MGFRDYAGSKFEPFILPIIPKEAGSKLVPGSSLTPDRLGKIPGVRYPEGWGGFRKAAPWSKHISTAKHLASFARMYAEDGFTETLGFQARRLPAIDIDWENPEYAQIVEDLAFEMLGVTPVRIRPNSPKRLLIYRLSQESGDSARPVVKRRLVWRTMFGEQGAVELLGEGQQYLVEGLHPSGVHYEWLMGISPLVKGYDGLPEVTADQLEAFMAKLDEAMTTVHGLERVKGGGNPRMIVFSDTKPAEVGPNHPGLCPDLDMLRDVLENYLPCTLPEFATYDEWAAACVAIVTACGKDESFWPDFLEWCSAVPENASEGEDYIRGKWESVNESKIGWAYLCSIAHDYGYAGDAQRAFDPLPVSADQPSLPTPRRDGTHEGVIADHFVAENARKKWIFVSEDQDRKGHWRRFDNGVWAKDPTSFYDVTCLCQTVGDKIRANSAATPAQLLTAKSMFSDRTARAVHHIAQSHPSIVVDAKQLDKSPLFLGVPGGYIDPDGKLRDADPKTLLTKRTGVRPDFGARCPLFESRLMCLANKDPEVYECLWSLIGYGISGLGRSRSFVFIHGQHGGEGKTTLTTTLGLILGDYARAITNKAFVKTKYEQRFSVSSLSGYHLVYSNEIERGEEWASARLKEATGGGVMEVERKREHAEQMKITSHLWFTGNDLPVFPPGDEALKSRMVLIEANTPVPSEEDIEGFAEILVAQEGPAILARAIEWRQRYLRDGKLLIPASIRDKVNEHFLENDPIWQWAQERCEFVANGAVTEKQAFFDDYRRWEIEDAGRKIPSNRNTFYKRLENHPEIRKRGVEFTRARLVGGRANNARHVVKGMHLITGFEATRLEGVSG